MTSLFERLFGKAEKPSLPPRDIEALMRPLAVPAIHITRGGAPSRSHLGGVPDGAAGFTWPEHAGQQLGFLAQLSLPDLHATHAIDWLPTTGCLLFFYDIDAQPWGFDPQDRGAARVLHIPDLPAQAAKAHAPLADAPPALPRHDVAFRKIDVFPSWERACVEALHLSDEESDAYSDAAEAVFDDGPQHQVGGYPAPIQGDFMELKCQLVTNGLYLGTPAGYEGEAAEKLKAGADEWVLLLQLDTDDELEVMWGDGGRLYFWVRKEAARAGDFSKVWAVLQCY